MKLGRDIARGEGHLVHEFDLNDLDLRGNSGHFKGLNHICALFAKFIVVIPTKLGRDIAANLTSNDLDLGKWWLF